MSQPRARIASQLGLALAVILAVVISGSTVFALRSLDTANLATREEHLASEARLLSDQLNTFHSTLRESTQRLSGLLSCNQLSTSTSRTIPTTASLSKAARGYAETEQPTRQVG